MDEVCDDYPSDFHYNPLHDLESLWWIASHFLLTRTVMREGDDGEWAVDSVEHYRQLRNIASEIFGERDFMQFVMTTSTYLPSKVKLMHPSTRDALKRLIDARRELVRAYRVAEKDLNAINLDVVEGVHKMLRDCFSAISDQYDEHDLHMEPVPYR